MPIVQILMTSASATATPTFTFTPQTVSANEGSEFTFEIGGTNIVDGTYYWTIETSSSEFTTTSGSFSITSNYGVITVTPDADTTIEDNETFTVSIRSDSISGTILATSESITINGVTLLMSLVADDYSGSGTTWTDTSGSSHPGTLVNSPTYQGTTIPKYFTFDRTNNQYVQGPDLGNLSTWTMEAWFRLSEDLSTTDSTAIITTTYDDGAGTGYQSINYVLGNFNENNQVNGNSELTVGFYLAGQWRTTAGFVPTVGSWYHVVGTYDGTTLKQWVNGVLDTGGVRTITATPIANSGPVRIARRWDSASDNDQQFFPGDIAVAKIYRGALSGNEIAAIFNATKNNYVTYSLNPQNGNLVDEGSGQTFSVYVDFITTGTYYWTVEDRTSDFSTISGTFTITSNAGSFTVTPTADGISEEQEIYTVAIRSGSITGPILATASAAIDSST